MLVTAMIPQRTAELHTFRGHVNVSTDLMKGNVKSLINTWTRHSTCRSQGYFFQCGRNAVQQLMSRCCPGVVPLTQGRMPFTVCSPPSHSLLWLLKKPYMMFIKYTTYCMVVYPYTIQTAFLLQTPKIEGRCNRHLNLPKDLRKG